jgi:hypothetical protein
MGKRDEWKCGGEEERKRRKTDLKVGHYKCRRRGGHGMPCPTGKDKPR